MPVQPPPLLLSSAKIAYCPMSPELSAPGDRRRFCFFANQAGVKYEIYNPQKKYDLVVLTQNSDISYWSRLEKGTAIIFDFIDSYLVENRSIKTAFRGWAKYISGQNKFLELSYKSALKKLCSRSQAVICSTLEQSDSIKPYCENTHIVFDAHFNDALVSKSNYESHEPFRLVWEGLPSNIYQLKSITELIASNKFDIPIELHIITDRVGRRLLNRYFSVDIPRFLESLPIKTYFYEWSAKNLSTISLDCDLAIIPIDLTNPFASGKPENKLLLFWRMGLPVLVSATPAYIRAMNSSGQIYYAFNDADWIECIRTLMESKEKRQEAAKKGKDLVLEKYSQEILLNKWRSVFTSIGFSC